MLFSVNWYEDYVGSLRHRLKMLHEEIAKINERIRIIENDIAPREEQIAKAKEEGLKEFDADTY